MTKLVIDEPSKKQTVGKFSLDLLKSPDPVSAVEQMRESLTEYEENVFKCIEAAKKDPIYVNKDFYVVVLTKQERLMQNVMRNMYFTRFSCPTPDWDQTVYKFKRKGDQLVFMWVIPSKQTCQYMIENEHLLPREEQNLLKYVKSDRDGTLLRLAKELNGERADSSLLENFKYKG